MKKNLALLVLAALLGACAAHAGPIAAGLLGGLAVLDQLLAAGVIDPIQHHQLVQSLQDASTVAKQAVSVAEQAQRAADAIKAGTLTTEEGVGLASGITAVGLAAMNAYRNATRKNVLHPPTAAGG
ncbi:MAG: hypothetical protein INH34_01640 [Phycisphaerales bacterium]|nr:hypothetical protein [Phycisphaerales bacterium]